MRRALSSLIAVLTAAVLVACTTTAEPAPTAAPTIPATPVGEVAQWVIDELESETDADAGEWAERLHESFLAEVSADEIVELLNQQIRPARPFELTNYRGGEEQAVLTLAGSVGDPFDLSLVIDGDALITGLFLAPATPPRDPAASLDEVEDRLAALPAEVSVLIARDGETLIERGADDPAPIGSIFKLYVLGAVADAVDAGDLAWDDVLTIDDDVRSLPSGDLHEAPTGTEVSVLEAARAMISVSDNTATDLLMRAVGRERVEAAVVDLGHEQPELLRPFPTTREVFRLLWSVDETQAARWADGDEDERRALLAELEAEPFTLTAESLTADDLASVAWPRGAEWFASARDVVTALDSLAERGDARVDEILGLNAGVAIDTETWPQVAFKGGSSPGVLAGGWLARSETSSLSVVVLVRDDSEVSELQAEVFGLVADVFVIES